MVSVFPETQYEHGQSFVPSLIESTLPEVVQLGDGTFSPNVSYQESEGPALFGDVNNDGRADLVTRSGVLLNVCW